MADQRRERHRRVRQEAGDPSQHSCANFDENDRSDLRDRSPFDRQQTESSLTASAAQEDELDEESDLTAEELTLQECKYEYLDHPADIQLHGWGETLSEAFEQTAVAMFGYMTEIDKVDIEFKHQIEATSDDMEGLLFQFLDECLFAFCCEPNIIASKVVINEFDRESFRISATLYGEEFNLEKHPQGTEVKAITYASMQIIDDNVKPQVFCIVDI